MPLAEWDLLLTYFLSVWHNYSRFVPFTTQHFINFYFVDRGSTMRGSNWTLWAPHTTATTVLWSIIGKSSLFCHYIKGVVEYCILYRPLYFRKCWYSFFAFHYKHDTLFTFFFQILFLQGTMNTIKCFFCCFSRVFENRQKWHFCN